MTGMSDRSSFSFFSGFMVKLLLDCLLLSLRGNNPNWFNLWPSNQIRASILPYYNDDLISLNQPQVNEDSKDKL